MRRNVLLPTLGAILSTRKIFVQMCDILHKNSSLPCSTALSIEILHLNCKYNYVMVQLDSLRFCIKNT